MLQRFDPHFLWGEEKLDSKLFTYLYKNNRVKELKIIIRYFWSIQNQELETSYEDKIIEFWRKCAQWVQNENEIPEEFLEEFLSDLGILSCYLESIDDEKKEWLLLSAPFIGTREASNDLEYARYLDYLVDHSPAAVLEIFEKQIASHIPYYDHGDHYKSIIDKLGENNDKEIRRRSFILCEKLINLPGFQELYDIIKQRNSRNV